MITRSIIVTFSSPRGGVRLIKRLVAVPGDTVAMRNKVLRPFREVFLRCPNLCEAMPKPVVCQIQRACVGGALEVALGCDLRVACTDAQFGLLT